MKFSYEICYICAYAIKLKLFKMSWDVQVMWLWVYMFVCKHAHCCCLELTNMTLVCSVLGFVLFFFLLFFFLYRMNAYIYLCIYQSLNITVFKNLQTISLCPLETKSIHDSAKWLVYQLVSFCCTGASKPILYICSTYTLSDYMRYLPKLALLL